MTNCCHQRLNGKLDSFYLYHKCADVNGLNDVGFPDTSSNSVCLRNHVASRDVLCLHLYVFSFFQRSRSITVELQLTIQHIKQVCPAAK